MEKKFNYFYRITNIINNKFYYGVHSTNNLNDGYLGSGLRIKHAIKKYGKENFVKEELAFFNTFDEALEYESKIVVEDLINDPDCYNLTLGGRGGHKEDYVSPFLHLWQTDEFRKRKTDEFIEMIKKIKEDGKFKCWPRFTGKHHTTKTKRIIGDKNSIKQSGVNNSQYGSFWITNGIESKKINFKDDIPEGWKKGRKMNKSNSSIMSNHIGSIVIHNNTLRLNKTIPKNELEKYNSEGWKRGRISEFKR
jgi:hypothetical protein